MEVYLGVIVGGLVSAAPSLVTWIAAIIIATVFLRRRGGRAEKFLLIGAGVMLVSSLFIIPGPAVVPYLVEKGSTLTDAASAARSLNLLHGAISMIGIVCLAYAFWMKFNQAKILGRT